MELAFPLMSECRFTQWLREARAGSPDALGQALTACEQCLARCGRLQIGRDVRAKLDADDLVQETFAQALEDFRYFQRTSGEQFQCWLVKVLLHSASKERRQYRGASKRQVSREVALDNAGRWGPRRDELEARGPSPSRRAEDREQEEKLSGFLSDLSERERRVVALRIGEDLPYEEIGVRVGCSAEAARKVYDRVLKHLAERMQD